MVSISSCNEINETLNLLIFKYTGRLPGEYVTTLELYTPSSDNWSVLPGLILADGGRLRHSVIVLGSKHYIIGGKTKHADEQFNVLVYDHADPGAGLVDLGNLLPYEKMVSAFVAVVPIP